MIQIRREVRLPCAQREAFSVLSDPRNASNWLTGCRSVEQEGAVWNFRCEAPNGFPFTISIDWLADAECSRIRGRYVSSPSGTFVMAFEPIDGDETILRYEQELTFGEGLIAKGMETLFWKRTLEERATNNIAAIRALFEE